MADKTETPGENLAAVFSERGAPLDPAEGRRVLELLLRLFELGVLRFDEGLPPGLCNTGGPKYTEDDE